MFPAPINLVETTLLLSIAAYYIVSCPFNKVEESFNTQAVHDFVNIFPHNLPSLQNISDFPVDNQREIAFRKDLPWDHTRFPGVVPRTFIGALLVSIPTRLAKIFIVNGYMSDGTSIKDEHDLTAQFLLQIGSRITLAAFLVISLGALLKSIHKHYGLAFRLCFLVISISQFHYFFYAGRFIPNTYAAILSNMVLASWISRQYSKSLLFIALCVIIFRFDTAIFFGWLLIDAVFIRKILRLNNVLAIGIPAGFFAILITFTIDSIFWARPVWPELEGFKFNVVQNKSHEWGVQPYFWYIYDCIPRIMLSSVFLPLVGYNTFTRNYLIPVLLFIITYSFLPHKELRFILFVTPWLNLCAASGLMNIHFYLNKFFINIRNYSARQRGGPTEQDKSRGKTIVKVGSKLALLVFSLVILGMFSANMIASFILVRVSSHNYPGGHAALSLGVNKELLDGALETLNSSFINPEHTNSNVAVYVNNLAAQTGLSRFVQVDGVFYSKTPKLDATTFKRQYKLIYLILEPEEVSEYFKLYCKFSGDLLDNRAIKWRRSNSELKCALPNQSEMFCSLVESIECFKSVNIGGLLRKFKHLDSFEALKKILLDDKSFIRTRIALNTIRCSAQSLNASQSTNAS